MLSIPRIRVSKFLLIFSQVLESHLMDLYRTLKRILSTDADQVVQAQASQALEILNENTRQLFSAKPNLEKKIHIMQPL